MDEITINLQTKQATLEAYLPFIKNGALKIHCLKVLTLNQHLKVSLSFPEIRRVYAVQGVVVWIEKTSDPQKGDLYGIQFMGEQAKEIHKTIENYLAGLLHYDR